MLIIGAGGLAKQFLEVLVQSEITGQTVFFDDVNYKVKGRLYDVPVYCTEADAVTHFKKLGNQFLVAVASPYVKEMLIKRFEKIGGTLVNLISPFSHVSKINTRIDTANILTGSIIENGVSIGRGVLINIGSFITHDSVIGDYTEICPGVRISGECSIGSYCRIGTGTIILPKIKIGNNVIAAAGSVITKDIPDNSMVAGVPAAVKKILE